MRRLKNALILSEVASKVFMIHRRKGFSARASFVDKVKNTANVEILTGSQVTKVHGNERVEGAEILDAISGVSRPLDVDLILVRIGVTPNSDLFEDQLELDERRYIRIDHQCETNVKGVFAVGDIANPASPTISSAVGMGATAVKVIRSRIT